MIIIVDGAGNDKGSLEMLQGAAAAVAELGVDILFTGDEKTIKALALEHGIDLRKIEILQADSILTMEDEPMSITREKKDSSMAVAFEALKAGRGDALVSAGNTGALVAGASLIVRRLKGVKRAALVPNIPTRTGTYLLVDGGANVECRPEMLLQFGIMGSVYMKEVMGIQSPRVGIVNNGTESHKGTALVLESAKLLQSAPINFVGSVEAKELNNGGCDVAVTDGFTGNVILKLSEGLATCLIGILKDAILAGGMGGKIGAMLLKPAFAKLKKTMDVSEAGGVPLLGIRKPVIKAHGSSDAKAVKNAIKQAAAFANADVIGKIEEKMATLHAQNPKGEAND